MGWTPGEVWRLVRGDELVGEIVVEDADFPWLSGRFVPQRAFDDVKPLFERELALTESDLPEEVDVWERLYSQITDALTLVSPRGPAAGYILHIEGDEAWFRWADTPFDSEV